MSVNTTDSGKPFRFSVYVPINSNLQPVPRDAFVAHLCDEGSRRPKPAIVQLEGKSHALCSKVAQLTIQQYGKVEPPETRFTTIADWLRTDQSRVALWSNFWRVSYFLQELLGVNNGIDIVAVTVSSMSMLVLPPNSSVSFISESCSIRKPRYTLRFTWPWSYTWCGLP